MSTLKMFRLHLCQPINYTTLAGDFDWRNFVYDLKDISLERIDLQKKYQVFVETFTLRNYTGMIGAGTQINLAYCVTSPDLLDMQAFHSTQVVDNGVVLLHGHITDFKRTVQTQDIGFPVSLDFLRKRQIRIRLTALGGGVFASEVSPENGEDTLDSTYYRMTLLFTQLPQELQ